MLAKLRDDWNNNRIPSVPTKLNCCTIGGSGCAYTGGTECNAAMKAICATPAMGGDSRCKQWARENPLMAEVGVRSWCKERPWEPWCACVESKGQGVITNPLCYDDRCMRGDSFKPQAWVQSQCPDVITCTQINTIKSIGTTINPKIEASMNCGKTTGPAAGPIPAPQSSVENTPVGVMYLVILLVVVLLFSTIYGIYYGWNRFKSVRSVAGR